MVHQLGKGYYIKEDTAFKAVALCWWEQFKQILYQVGTGHTQASATSNISPNNQEPFHKLKEVYFLKNDPALEMSNL